ncbi:hypothetical protein CP973_32985 [Streptomyces albofaciens JCM 4342]|uniref:hypothetical protein n=1 Tax=Streptomyces albofaciens TaxID=66866 RepID=UPI00123B3133|nr:hypothetical protein [Streptomyces albofaciens]KAA6213979.1 hypothetical protein CP973_32985 [Streptomyces albofaciens JCM 4342]
MAQDTPMPPTTPEEALAIVLSRYARPQLADGSPASMHVHEFDIGYLVYPTYPPSAPVDPAAPPMPAPPGGANVVVAKDTGETVTVPNVDNDSAIASYRRHRARTATS